MDASRILTVIVDDPMTRDPEDDFLVLLAEVEGSDVLVSGDPDLVAVQRRGLVVITARAFLDDLAKLV
ncbi:MAG: hypothetical protein ACP5PJ_08925 [Acidimicrobiales bacterium]